jgi:enoyl-CoA hydratase
MSLSGGVARIVIDDGKVNAMTASLLSSISDALTEAGEANAVAVISGRRGIFSAGFDRKTFAAGPDASRLMLEAGVKAILDILRYPRPIITCAAGHAYPMGAFLMLAADIRLGVDGDFRIGMNETAIMIDVPEFALAIARSRLTPPAYAAIRTARMFTPNEAVAAGYLDFAGDERAVTARLEREIDAALKLEPGAFKSTKARMNAETIRKLESAGLPV